MNNDSSHGNMHPAVKKIRTASKAGLWGSVGVVIAAACFVLASPWRFYASNYTAKMMLIVATVLTVGVVSSVLLTARKRVPQLRQTDGLDAKLSGYASYISGMYWTTLLAVVVTCIMAVLSAQSQLLMLAMVSTLVLFLTYPNIYRIKVDLGLSDEEMKNLFGDKYISDEGKD